MYGIESYVGVPVVRSDGSVFGTLCALDPDPKAFRRENLDVFQLLATLISQQLEAAELAEERELFLDAVGHDMRTPLQSIALGADLVESLAASEPRLRSTAERLRRNEGELSTMMDDLVDMTRGRLGRRMALAPVAGTVGGLLESVVLDWPGASRQGRLRLEILGSDFVTWDPARIVQLVRNLVSNAFHHGAPDEPVTVRFDGRREPVTLTVHNRGEPIAPEILGRLFEPFFRSPSNRERSGLGLGLFIVGQIAGAHGGEVGARSSPGAGTEIVATLPRHVAPR